jgi:prepilin-type N-terminal cleavage/methylation domain-containing protein
LFSPCPAPCKIFLHHIVKKTYILKDLGFFSKVLPHDYHLLVIRLTNVNGDVMKTMTKIPARKERGFTLIEIAIVLVIIGLLLGGVLQGQQLIENSRVKSATNDINGIAAAAFSYQDRYGRMPGDDGQGTLTNLTGRGGSWASLPTDAVGNSNGILDATAAATFTGAAAEGTYFFTHLRAAGFITGDPATAIGAAVLPANPFGGLTGVTGQTIDGNMAGTKICMSNVSGSAGIALDTQLDDGQPDSGRFRAFADATATAGVTPPGTTAGDAAAAYDENLTFTLCYRM